MQKNSFGQLLTLTTFGESHGVALGAVIDGCPAGVNFDLDLLHRELKRRRPGGKDVSPRAEEDTPEILSGVFEGKTLGTPIAIIVRNKDARSQDYQAIQNNPRAGHADDVWKSKFGHSDYRGGGRSSGRETLARVMGGAVAQMICRQISPDLKVKGFVSQISDYQLTSEERNQIAQVDVDSCPLRFPSAQAQEVQAALQAVKARGDSWGGVLEVLIQGVPPGLGQPVFRKLKSDLAQAILSIGAVNGFELGEGFAGSSRTGKDFHGQGESPYGGIRGGISTGQDIVVSASIKPTSSIMDVAKSGRHDPFIGVRAVPVIEAMVWLVLAEHLLWQRLDRI